MDTTIHINVADIPPEVGESFGRVTLAGYPQRCRGLSRGMAALPPRRSGTGHPGRSEAHSPY